MSIEDSTKSEVARITVSCNLALSRNFRILCAFPPTDTSSKNRARSVCSCRAVKPSSRPGYVCVACGNTRAKDPSVSMHRFPKEKQTDYVG